MHQHCHRRSKRSIAKDERELAKIVRQFVDATSRALQEDEKVKNNNEQQQLAIQALEKRPFEPLNRNLFVPAIYPETPPLVPASGPPREEQVMTLLKKYLTKDWPNDPRIQRIGLEIFNHPLVKEKISNPSLRAALVGLGRTVAVDAIEFILFAQTAESLPKITEIKFDDQNLIPEDSPGVAFTLPEDATGQVSSIFNRRYEAENPFLLSPIMAHEPLHSDPDVADFEEVINLALHSFVHLQQVSLHPELASLGSALTRRSNPNAFARINAGEGHRLGNITNDDRSLPPGSPLLFTEWSISSRT